MQNEHVLHVLISLQNWGESEILEGILKRDSHIISIYHTMGKSSYLLDANFDTKEQLRAWIVTMKQHKLSSGVPAIQMLKTQKIIDVYKQKKEFDLQNYQDLYKDMHFFMYVDHIGEGKHIIDYIKNIDYVQSMVHIQGEHSFILEIVVKSYDQYKEFVSSIKKVENVQHIETSEVISVLKYRNQVITETGQIAYPKDDIRELYTL